MEKHYVFIKDNRVVQIGVFEKENQELANFIVTEQNYDNALWIDNNSVPHIYSEYNPIDNTFISPTDEYLISIGVMNLPVEEPTDV